MSLSRSKLAGAVRALAVLATCGVLASCAQPSAGEDTVRMRSAVNSNVVVTVLDGASVPQPNIEVFAIKTNGTVQTSAFTNTSGQATLSLPATSYRFKVEEAGSFFYSGASGHCTTPACTSATITIRRVDVTVVNTSGTPDVGRQVFWKNSSSQVGGYAVTGANGHVLFAVPDGTYKFAVEINGWEFESNATPNCAVPGCTAATITTTIPVTVTVTNTSGTPQQNVVVAWETAAGGSGGYLPTNASGVVTLSAPQGSFRFFADVNNTEYVSGAQGHCTIPGCTSASIVISLPVDVLVVDTAGTPLSGKTVMWQRASDEYVGGNATTNASGHATVYPPQDPSRFKTTIDGTDFFSGAAGHCVQPTCASTATILVSQQTVVTVVDGNGAAISGKAVTPLSDEGTTASNKTTNTSGQATFRLPFGHWRFRAKCSSNEPFFSGDAGHCYNAVAGCVTSKIKMPCGQCTGQTNGTACNDQNPCTGSSTCQSQFCTGANPMSCAASDQCHDAGACNAETAACSNPPKANGSSCSDGNACTQADTCQSGSCSGSNSVTCTASDQCHVAGTCNTATGVCSNPDATNGTGCNDNQACTQADTCQSGTCTGNQVTCVAQDQCHVAGSCQEPSGSCTNPLAPEGTPCGSGMQCTAGSCQSSAPAGNPPPTLDPTVPMDLRQATAFLYEGPNAQQVGVTVGTIRRERVAVFRGRTLNRAGQGIPNVAVRVRNHSEYGLTRTDENGVFSLAVNGGEQLRLEYEAEGFLPVQRSEFAPALDYAWFPDVVLTPVDSARTVVDLSVLSSILVAQATPNTDASGSRQSVLLFAPGTQATLEVATGASIPLTTLTVHSTEYTVGDEGPLAMPADLPPASAYTYAVELSVEEATGTEDRVRFSQPVLHYVDNFLHFPIGTAVPSGFYDRKAGSWVPAPNGRVIKILDTLLGIADVDADGDGVADTAEALSVGLGMTNEERMVLASLYLPGDSVWRVPVTHFSIYDCNWPFSPPLDAISPVHPNPRPQNRRPPGPCKEAIGSSVACSSQILSERIGITGTPFSLAYSSDRAPAFAAGTARADITLSGPTVPGSLARIDLITTVAGQTRTQSFPPLAAQQTSVEWDGKDGFGRIVTGRQPAHVVVKYVYAGSYKQPTSVLKSAFGAFTDGLEFPFDSDFARNEFTFSSPKATVQLERPNAATAEGLGGWTLDVHHVYDPRTLHLTRGDGETASADSVGGRSGENVSTIYPACSTFGCMIDFKGAQDGSVYISSMLNANEGRVLHVLLDGTIQVAAPGVFPKLLATSGQTVYFTDQGNPYGNPFPYGPTLLRRVNADGSTTIVGGSSDVECLPSVNGTHPAPLFGGDDGPATDACLEDVLDFALAPDGTIYILARARAADSGSTPGLVYWRLRRIDADGTIRTVTSGGHPGDDTLVAHPEYLASRLAIDHDHTSYLQLARLLDFVPSTGATSIGPTVIEKLFPNGELAHLAGNETSAVTCWDTDIANGISPTTGCTPSAFALDAVGAPHFVATVRFVDARFQTPPPNQASGRIMKVGSEGLLAEAFAGFNLNLNGFYPPSFAGDGSVVVFARPYAGLGGFDSDYWGAAALYRLSAPLPAPSAGGYLLPGTNGREIYSFDETGRHLRTYATGGLTTKYEFLYDARGLLLAIKDRNQLTTTIERDSDGKATGIVSPVGQRTTLEVGPDGYLQSVTSPGGAFQQFIYDNGAMTREVDARGGVHDFEYDSNGRLTSDRSPTTGQWTFVRNAIGTEVTSTSPEGTARTYSLSEPVGARQQGTIDGAGISSTLRVDAVGAGTATSGDGVLVKTNTAPDPRFGVAVPYVAERTVTTPGGLISTRTTSRQMTFAPGNPLSLSSQTDTMVVNGRTTTIAFDATTRTTTATSPAGRVATLVRNDRGRPIFFQEGTLAPRTLTYDSLGRPSTITIGTGTQSRTTVITYDSLNRQSGFADPSTVSSIIDYDADNRVTSVARAGTSPTILGYNGAGDLTSVTPPDRSAYVFGHTAAGDGTSFAVPAVGAESPTTGFEYDLDRRLTRVLGADGTQTTHSYEPGTGRLASIAYPRESGSAAAGNIVATMGYSATTGKVGSISVTDGPQVAFQFDGELPLLTSWSGAITGSVGRAYNNDFLVASETVNAGYTVTFGYDADGLVTQIGDLALTRDAPNGLVTDSSIGNVTDHSTYTPFGEIRDYDARHLGTSLYHCDYETRDALGRVEVKEETVQDVTTTWAYSYDTLGRLTQVIKNNVLTATYAYDSNGNRTSAPGLTSAPTYDAQDRLLTYGNWTFTYTAGGDLATKTDASTGAVTRYHYDGVGALRRVELPDGRVIDYVIDPLGRRVGKKMNGVLVRSWLYLGDLSIVAELDGSGAIVSRFVGREYFVRNGVSYRLITDELGTVRLVVNAASGEVAQRLDYDEFGHVTSDSSPGFQPLGFAGGLYDSDTGLVRFGARDYDSATGRWTSRDPILFGGGATNLFVYVNSDPINLTDPTGLTELYFNIESGTLFVDPEDGGSMYEIKATSGDPDQDCMNKSACKKADAGPTPKGKWKLRPRDRKPIGVDEHRANGEDWGSFRVRLIPSPALRREIIRMGRKPDTFYLHGGKDKGTEGCIDLGGGNYGNSTIERLLQDLMLDPDNNVPLLVW